MNTEITTITASTIIDNFAAALAAAPVIPTKIYRSTAKRFVGRTWQALHALECVGKMDAELAQIAKHFTSLDHSYTYSPGTRPSDADCLTTIRQEFRASIIECTPGLCVIVSRKSLQTALEVVIKATDKKSTMPVLSHVLLNSTHAGLEIKATDLYISAQTVMFQTSTRLGAVCLPAKDLLDRIKAAKSDEVTIEQEIDSGPVTVTLGSANFCMHGLPGESFPALPTPEEWPAGYWEHTSDATEFLADWAYCAPAISTDDTRPHLNGLLIEDAGARRLRMVSTDGHRLALAGPDQSEASPLQTLLIPLTGMQAIVNALKKSKATAITFSRDKCDIDTADIDDRSGKKVKKIDWAPNVFCTVGAYTVSVKLVDAQFPAYQQVIPRNGDTVLAMDGPALAAAIKRVAVAASDRTGGVKFSQPCPGQMNISAESPENGSCAETIACEGGLHLATERFPHSRDGAPAPTDAFGVNAKYLLDAIGKTTARICLRLSAAIDPVVVTAEGDDTRLAVVMPMTI